MLANVSFGASVVAMNAYLPSLAKESPEVVSLQQEILNEPESDPITHSHSQPQEPNSEYTHNHLDHTDPEDPEAPLIPRASQPDTTTSLTTKQKYDATLSRATSRISSLGIAMGYAAGIFLLIVALVPVTKLGGSTFALRLAIGLSGIWWGLFSVPAAVWLPGAGEGKEGVGDDGWVDGDEGEGYGERRRRREEGEWKVGREIWKAWVRLGDMLRWSEVVKLRNTFKYLAAWFLLSDGMSSLILLLLLIYEICCGRLYDDNVYSSALCQNISAHACIVINSYWSHNTHIWNPRLPPLAPHPTQIRTLKSHNPNHTRSSRVPNPSLRLPRLPNPKLLYHPLRRAHDSRRDVRARSGVWFGLRSISGVRSSVLCGDDTTGGGSEVVWVIFDYR